MGTSERQSKCSPCGIWVLIYSFFTMWVGGRWVGEGGRGFVSATWEEEGTESERQSRNSSCFFSSSFNQTFNYKVAKCWSRTNEKSQTNWRELTVVAMFFFRRIKIPVVSVLASIWMWMAWESPHYQVYLLNIKPDQNIFCSSWQAVRRYAMEGGRGEEGGERSDEGGDEGEEEDAADRWYSKVRLRAAVLSFLW